MMPPWLVGRNAVIVLAFCCVAGGSNVSIGRPKDAAVDNEQYADSMANEVWDVQDLAENAEIQRRMFNRMTPPGMDLIQPMYPAVAPFDAEYFSESFLERLLGEERNSVAIYPLSLALDPKTRDVLIYNAEGKLIASMPSDGVSRIWPEGADPSRIVLEIDLLPAEDVEQYLYTESRIAGTLAAHSSKTAKSPRTGEITLKSLTPEQFGIANIQHLTNGNFRLTVTNGADVAEVFSYTAWRTSSVEVIIWTNEESNVVASTNIIWTPTVPSFNGLAGEWDFGTTNLVLTNGVGAWEDSNIPSNAQVRFYGAAKRADSDGDGLTDGAEKFVYHTESLVPDTDADGMGDGDEVDLTFDPLIADDYIEVWISSVNGGRP